MTSVVIYFLIGVIFAYAISQLGLLATVILVSLTVSGVLLWRKKRPQDFILPSHNPRALMSLIYALIFFASYWIVRMAQPTNYHVHNLAAITITFVLMAIYFGTVGRRKPLP